MKKSKEKSAADDYDRTVNELFFESKAKASDRLQTEEEVLRKEKMKLEELEVLDCIISYLSHIILFIHLFEYSFAMLCLFHRFFYRNKEG